MKYVKLGRTGLSVSRVGSDHGSGIRAGVHRALELGVNVFDVATSYGHGKAEKVLGRAL